MSKANEMSHGEFVVFAACTMLLTALGIDIMLPAFGAVRDHFNLGPDSTAASQIIAFFFMGQVGQIISGSLSDRYGRLAILRTGFFLYLGGGVGAAVAPSLASMYAPRFIAGMGAAALWVSTLACVRDRFAGDKMARTMSLILTIFLFTPVITPFIGTAVLSIASWQVVFLIPPVLPVFFWSLRLNESLPPERRLSLRWHSFPQSARQAVGNRTFVRYAAITTTLFSAFSSYIGSSERIVREVYGRPELFSWIFAGSGVVMALCTFLNAHLAARFGARKTIRGLLTIFVIAAGALLSLTLALGGRPNIFTFFAFVALLSGINAATEPNGSALALEPMGEKAGLAAALYGTSFFVIGAVAGSFINILLVDSILPLAIAYFIVGLISNALAYADHSRPLPIPLKSDYLSMECRS